MRPRIVQDGPAVRSMQRYEMGPYTGVEEEEEEAEDENAPRSGTVAATQVRQRARATIRERVRARMTARISLNGGRICYGMGGEMGRVVRWTNANQTNPTDRNSTCGSSSK